MRAFRVLTNETCNQHCAFCDARRPFEREDVARAERVLLRIQKALEQGASEIVLTGGEPTLRRDLPLLIERALVMGARRVTLETNAALIDEGRARALSRAGLSRARVHLPAWGEEADRISRDEGGFERTLKGLAALCSAGIEVQAALPVVRSNIASLPDWPRRFFALGLPVKSVMFFVPHRAPSEDELVSVREAARAIALVCEAGQAFGMLASLDQSVPIPPCAFEQPGRVAHLFSLTKGGGQRPNFSHPPACERCDVRDRCPGLHADVLAREADFEPRPIASEKTRRRLSMVGRVEEQIARELVTRETRRLSDGGTLSDHVVRILFHCNQSCRFCFVSTHLPAAQHEAIVRAIVEIGAMGGILTLSGGEPTLHPRLIEYIRLGRSSGAREIVLQTNALRLSEPGFAQTLVEAGVGVFFVSLHASHAGLSDRITEAPGTFEKTLLGIDEIAKTSSELSLNFVFCTGNSSDFPNYIEMVGKRWPKASVTVSHVAASTDVVPQEKTLIPRLSDMMPFLREGIERAGRLGLEIRGFESMCGIPLCQIPDELSPYFKSLGAAPDAGGEFIKADVCKGCALSDRCFGIRRAYAALYGTSEFGLRRF